jgi:hypothetical protein
MAGLGQEPGDKSICGCSWGSGLHGRRRVLAGSCALPLTPAAGVHAARCPRGGKEARHSGTLRPVDPVSGAGLQSSDTQSELTGRSIPHLILWLGSRCVCHWKCKADQQMPRAVMTVNSRTNNVAPGSGRQGRVKDPARDKRLAANRTGPNGQGRVVDSTRDRRLAANRQGPSGQGRVKDPTRDKRLSANRSGRSG